MLHTDYAQTVKSRATFHMKAAVETKHHLGNNTLWNWSNIQEVTCQRPSTHPGQYVTGEKRNPPKIHFPRSYLSHPNLTVVNLMLKHLCLTRRNVKTVPQYYLRYQYSLYICKGYIYMAQNKIFKNTSQWEPPKLVNTEWTGLS